MVERMGSVLLMPHILIILLYLAIPALILYWIVRLAVRHGMRDSRK
jgi:hypothetical protein